MRSGNWIAKAVALAWLMACAVATTSAEEAPPGLWEPKEIAFLGPETSESDAINPFTDYRLLVTFKHGRFGDSRRVVRGFYAADGDAAETGADAGRVWKVRFSPGRAGEWRYSAELRTGPGIALDSRPQAGTAVELEQATGRFEVAPAPVDGGRDFYRRGSLTVQDGYFKFQRTGEPWLKGGANSPENLLAFEDFDGTYAVQADARDGEAAPPRRLHRYADHVRDWRPGDPTWRGGKGKGLIGAINYLASAGMNAAYFLTMNIGGDGNDVWPYADPRDRTRFDCSKLDQWEIVFRHMQRRGVLLHVVTQETENELLLDDGDVGRLRSLYYHELIARFGHHPGLVWNLGEENGPVEFSPEGQTPEQQRAMADFFHHYDRGARPVLIHTHATAVWKEDSLPALLGHSCLDGLSLQVDRPHQVHGEILKWRRRSEEAGRPWLITMDEAGPWHTGAVPDADDPRRDALRRHVLWGSLMGGAAGVEWYFGAKFPHNDLGSEDWRQRENLWRQTRHALDFFENYLPYWEMAPRGELTAATDDYCFAKPGSVYAIYVPGGEKPPAPTLDLEGFDQPFRVRWFDPVEGGPLRAGSVAEVSGGGVQSLGSPPAGRTKDWVALVVDATQPQNEPRSR